MWLALSICLQNKPNFEESRVKFYQEGPNKLREIEIFQENCILNVVNTLNT